MSASPDLVTMLGDLGRECAEELLNERTRVATVAGFPLGASVPAIKAAEAAQAVDEGAREVDMVLNVGALKGGKRRGRIRRRQERAGRRLM
jgi:deoxyribose-phosphate aldolase